MPDVRPVCVTEDCDEPILYGADRGRDRCYRCEQAAGLDPWRWTDLSADPKD